LLIAAALIGGHQEERTSKSSKAIDKEDSKQAGARGENALREQDRKS
jgi:hypothetical protein